MGQKKQWIFYKRVKESIFIPLWFCFLIVLVFLIQLSLDLDLGFLGILPQTFTGLSGLLLAPLIHGNFIHLMANIFPLFFLGSCLYFFYDRVADQVVISCYGVTNFIVWLFGRPYFHIGSSGLVYGLAVFLICLGLFRGSIKAILISIAVLLTYGSIVYGIIPSSTGRVSWESHLAGTCVGMFMAYFYSQKPRLSRY